MRAAGDWVASPPLLAGAIGSASIQLRRSPERILTLRPLPSRCATSAPLCGHGAGHHRAKAEDQGAKAEESRAEAALAEERAKRVASEADLHEERAERREQEVDKEG